MDFLRALAELRNPVLDAVMQFFTTFGEESLFILIALAFFWCIDKKRGYFLLFTGFAGIALNQILKMVFRIPRPWVLEPDFAIVESAREQATGYSFPSGHTQVAASLYGGVARSAKRTWEWIAGLSLALLVGFSRMYLGVHTPKDVLVSLGIGAILVLVLFPIVDRMLDRPAVILSILGALALVAVGNLVFLSVYPFPADVDAANYADALQTGWKLLGMLVGVVTVYLIDHYKLNFETEAVWWAQLCKLLLGFGVVMGVRVALKAPLNALLGAEIGGGVRYLLRGVVAGAVIPAFFRFLPKSEKKKRKRK